MNVPGFVAAVALITQAAGPASPPALPSCGNVERDIGRGFRLTQHMFDGAPDFTLKYEPPSSAVDARGVTMTAPFQMMFSQMNFDVDAVGRNPLAGPHVGFTNFEFRRPDNTRLGLGNLRLDCGDGTVLDKTFSADGPPDHIRVPITFHSPFLNQPEQRCLREIERTGRFRFTISERDPNRPSVIIQGRMPLRWAIAEVRRLWEDGLSRSAQGRCRLLPAPPPPF